MRGPSYRTFEQSIIDNSRITIARARALLAATEHLVRPPQKHAASDATDSIQSLGPEQNAAVLPPSRG
jgi:hypothetical protein